jgi:hypothetical protein
LFNRGAAPTNIVVQFADLWPAAARKHNAPICVTAVDVWSGEATSGVCGSFSVQVASHNTTLKRFTREASRSAFAPTAHAPTAHVPPTKVPPTKVAANGAANVAENAGGAPGGGVASTENAGGALGGWDPTDISPGGWDPTDISPGGWDPGLTHALAASAFPCSPDYFESCPGSPSGKCFGTLPPGSGFYTLGGGSTNSSCRINGGAGSRWSPNTQNLDVPCPYRFSWVHEDGRSWTVESPTERPASSTSTNRASSTSTNRSLVARAEVDSRGFKSGMTPNLYVGLQENIVVPPVYGGINVHNATMAPPLRQVLCSLLHSLCTHYPLNVHNATIWLRLCGRYSTLYAILHPLY